MKKGSILVILALQLALLAGAQSLPADDLPAIRLPSDAKGERNHVVAEGCDKQKPWGDCCDVAICNRKMPPGCTCTDKVESCSSACKDCKEVSSDPPRYVCRDLYDFNLEDYLKNGIPKCTKQKPWGDCCDMAICNKKMPPGCTCTDKVESCSSACKDCKEVSSDPPRYVCRDWYDFDLEDYLKNGIPECTKQKPWGDCCDVAICNKKMPPGCTCTDKVESCSSACKDCKEVSSDPPRYVCRDLYDFNLEDYLKNGIPKCTKQKPWGDCCDMAICNKKMPPGCTCTDKVESCSSTCKDCKEVSSDPPRYVCRDWYDFDLEDYLKNGIPECTKQKPWGDCCDDAICNKKMPPGCTCTDKVESCSSACKDCKEVSSDPPRYVCRDWYDFDLEDYLKNGIPKCTKQKPWGDCCDMAICNRRLPPGCRCGDEVESCSSACKNCEEVSSDPPRYVCRDLYDFDLEDWLENGIPKCT